MCTPCRVEETSVITEREHHEPDPKTSLSRPGRSPVEFGTPTHDESGI